MTVGAIIIGLLVACLVDYKDFSLTFFFGCWMFVILCLILICVIECSDKKDKKK